MEEHKREFTGVWIPRAVIEDDNLKPVDRLIFAEISCFIECRMSNETLAERAGCSEATAKRSIAKLKELGYILQTGFDGRVRKLSCLHNAPGQNELADSAKCTRQTAQNDPLDNNRENKRENSNANALPASAKKESKPYTLTQHVITIQGIKPFPVMAHQLAAAKRILDAGYSLEEAQAAADRMQADSYWRSRHWDMNNLARNITKYHKVDRDEDDGFIYLTNEGERVSGKEYAEYMKMKGQQ